MRWDNLNIVPRIEVYQTDFKRILGVKIPFTKKWVLKGYDITDNLITRIDKKERIVYLQYAEFIKQLKFCGYRLSEIQTNNIKNAILRDNYTNRITKYDFMEICERAYLTTERGYIIELYEFASSIKYKTFEEQRRIAEQLGLTHEELLTILNNINLNETPQII